MVLVSIVIPTFRRPELLKTAIESCLVQAETCRHRYEILVVDNAPEGSAREIVSTLAETSAIPVRYLHETGTGIARARNAGIAEANGRFVVFLDDDQHAASNRWLESLMRQALAGETAVFGPIGVCFAGDRADVPESATRIFRRELAAAEGDDITPFSAYLSTGNCLFEKASCFPTANPFSTDLDGLGGEDSEFIFRLTRRGMKLAWAPQAGIREFVPDDRTGLTYLANRSFRNGQIRSLIQFRTGGPLSPSGIRWMVVGVAQAAMFGAAALALAPVDAKRSSDARVRAYGGLGKVLWMKRFWHISYPTASKA